MKADEFKIVTGLISLGLIIGTLVGLYFGTTDRQEAIYKEAIEANAAEWTIDAKTGEKTFKWKGVEQ